tara:strand:+ start:663 stop:899 length:237 start_codon:yes stop_codon:yes gene_type:complete
MKDFKKEEEMRKQMYYASPEERKQLKNIADDINLFLKQPKINEESLRKVAGLYQQLGIIKDSFTVRLIRLLKQNHMIS